MKRAYRKRSYPLDEIRRFLEPGPIVLVSSAWQGTFNIMTMGWHMMLGFSPALFGCYIWEENHSYQMLRRSKECVINLPTLDLVDTVVGIGNCHGTDVNKFHQFGLTPKKEHICERFWYLQQPFWSAVSQRPRRYARSPRRPSRPKPRKSAR